MPDCGHIQNPETRKVDTVVILFCCYCSDPSLHCAICGADFEDTSPALGHNMELQYTVPSTCSYEGYELYICSRCGDEDKQTLPILEHTPVKKAVQVRSFFLEGKTEYRCGECGEILKTVTEPSIYPFPSWTFILGVSVLLLGITAIIGLKIYHKYR